jgi:hypothetical protein
LSVHTYPNVSLVTDDGALNATEQGTAVSLLPELETYQQESGLSFDAVNQADWNGTIADRILGLDRYTGGYVLLTLQWDWQKSAPSSGILNFTGKSIATGMLETFAIATWTVD